MTKYLSVDFKDVIKFLEDKYNIKNIHFVENTSFDGECNIPILPDYIKGEVVEK